MCGTANGKGEAAIKSLCSLLAIFAVCLTCAGCRQAAVSEPEQEHNADTMRITAVMPHDDCGYWTSVADGAREAGTKLPVDVKIKLPSVNYSVPQMTELIRAATAARVDAIIVQGVDDEDYISALESAVHQGIQVVLVDTDLPDFPAHLYIGTDNYAVGRALGERVVRMTDARATIGIISGAPGYPNLELRLQGVRDVIAPYPDMSIKRIEYDQYDSLTLLENYKQLSDPTLGIDTLLCLEGTAAMTMGGMLTERAPNFRYVIGFDYAKESLTGLASGMVDGLMIQQSHRMGYLSVEECYRYIRLGAYSQNTIHTGTTYITAADLDEEGNYEAP